MKHTLKNGEIFDVGLDAIRFFDDRSISYPVCSQEYEKKNKPISIIHEVPKLLDQGDSGGCVGFGLSNVLLAGPIKASEDIITEKEAFEIYYKAQHLDEWPGGAYTGAWPRYHGTSPIAGCKVLKRKGYIKGYRWCFTWRQFLLALSKNPIGVATDWFEGMDTVNHKGFIFPRGRNRGGHFYMVFGFDKENKFCWIGNSWPNWGEGGIAKIKTKHLYKLIYKRLGQAVVLNEKPLGEI